MITSLIVSILSGALIGWLAGKVMGESSGFWRTVLLGVGGSFIGGLVADLLHTGTFLSIVLDVAGACLLIYLLRKKK